MQVRQLLAPLAVTFVAWQGGRITSANLDWYATLSLPAWTPSGQVIGIVWTTLFVLAALGIVLYFRRVPELVRPYGAIGLLCLNGLLNVGWSWLFFGQHLIGAAVLCAAFLALSVLAIIGALWPTSKTAASLFVPYFAWVSFATYLNYVVWQMNR